MSTEENRGKKAVTRLEKLYNAVRENPRGAVVLNAGEAADILDYVQELETKLGSYRRGKADVGDFVEIVADDSTDHGYLIGSKGKLISITQTEAAPLLVDLGFGTIVSAKWEEIEKVED
jgi:hypothetical protein